jgi:hypothetical protein
MKLKLEGSALEVALVEQMLETEMVADHLLVAADVMNTLLLELEQKWEERDWRIQWEEQMKRVGLAEDNCWMQEVLNHFVLEEQGLLVAGLASGVESYKGHLQAGWKEEHILQDQAVLLEVDNLQDQVVKQVEVEGSYCLSEMMDLADRHQLEGPDQLEMDRILHSVNNHPGEVAHSLEL